MSSELPRRLTMSLIVIVLIMTIPLVAAAPRIIMFSGPRLDRPVVLTDWQANMDLVQALEQTTYVGADQLKDRPYLTVSFFWGPRWNAFINEGRPLSDLRPEEAGHHGRFYPAAGDVPAVLLQTHPSSTPSGVPKSVEEFGKGGALPARTVAMLKERGIPVASARR